MKKAYPKQEALLEALMSVAMAKDIIERYFHANVVVSETPCTCGFCRKKIPAKRPYLTVQSFERKDNEGLILCNKDCCDAAEVHEMEFFGCDNLESLPSLNLETGMMITPDELLIGYDKRLEAKMLDSIDKLGRFRESYQLVSSHLTAM